MYLWAELTNMTSGADLLKEQPLFSRISPEAREELAAHASFVKLPKDAPVYLEGDVADAMFVVVSGRCKSCLAMPDGAESVLAVYGPGDTFGERALLAMDRHWSTVKVITDCTLLRIRAEDIQAELDRNPALARVMAHRMNEQFAALRTRDTKREARSRMGRIVGMASVTASDLGPQVIEPIAGALREETGESVLLLTVRIGSGGPSLETWQEDRVHLNGAFAFSKDVTKNADRVDCLSLFVHGEPSEHEKIAAFVSHTSQHFRHVLIHADSNVPVTVTLLFLVQSDLAFIFLRQQSDDLYRANVLTQHIRNLPGGHHVPPLPILCVEENETPAASRTLAHQIGAKIHGYIRALPGPDATAPAAGPSRKNGRFGAHIRTIAREIGQRRTGLVLSSGGAKSLAHIGVIQVLEENGIDVDIVAGSSMGAYIAALWCHGLTGRQLEEIALDMEKPWSLFRILDFAFIPRRGFIKGNRIRRHLERAIGHVHFSGLQRSLRIVATDLETLERTVLDSGEVATAVQASMAMPGLVMPVSRDGRTYVDGGASDPLPVDVLINIGVDHIIAVSTIPGIEDLKAFQMVNQTGGGRTREFDILPPAVDRLLNYFHTGNILDTVVRSMHAAETRVAETSALRADILLRPVSCDGVWHDFRHPRKYIALGRHAAEQHLEELRALTRPKK